MKYQCTYFAVDECIAPTQKNKLHTELSFKKVENNVMIFVMARGRRFSGEE